MDDRDREWIARWRAYLDGFPPDGWPVDTLEDDLSMIVKNRLSGTNPRHDALYAEVGKMIAEKLKERGEASCPTTPSDPSTPP